MQKYSIPNPRQYSTSTGKNKQAKSVYNLASQNSVNFTMLLFFYIILLLLNLRFCSNTSKIVRLILRIWKYLNIFPNSTFVLYSILLSYNHGPNWSTFHFELWIMEDVHIIIIYCTSIDNEMSLIGSLKYFLELGC